jgi:hypothetical protein
MECNRGLMKNFLQNLRLNNLAIKAHAHGSYHASSAWYGTVWLWTHPSSSMMVSLGALTA